MEAELVIIAVAVVAFFIEKIKWFKTWPL